MASLLKTAMLEADVQTVLFLSDSTQIPRDNQAKVVEMGFTDLVVFLELEDRAEDARNIFRNELFLHCLLGASNPHI